MKYWGYARCSTAKQRITRQIENIKAAYPEATIVEEIYTGTKIEGRAAWNKLYKQIKQEAANGEEITLIFDEVSRLSRSAEVGFQIYEELFNLGVHLVFLKEPQINSNTYKSTLDNQIQLEAISDQDTNDLVQGITNAINKYILALAKKQIFLAFQTAETEVEYLHQRTSEGVRQAQLAGKRVGTPKGSSFTTKKSIAAKETIRQHSKDFGGTLSDVEVMKLIGCARNSYYKWKKELINAEI